MCRRDPYHGIMRSATVGYPQTVVIMAPVKRTDAARTFTRTQTHADVEPHTGLRPADKPAGGKNDDLSTWQRRRGMGFRQMDMMN